MGIPNAKPNIGGSAQPAITRPCPNLLKAAEKQLASEPSRLWAEFRLAVVGHLAVCDLQHGQLESELSSLAAKKWAWSKEFVGDVRFGQFAKCMI